MSYASRREPACIVLAGGLGTRLRAAVPDRPKCLAPVSDSSFLTHQLRMLASRGVAHFVLALGHQADLVLAALEPLASEFSLESIVEPHALGTGGAILHSMAHATLAECLVANGDTWLDADLAGLMRPLHCASNERVRMGCLRVADRGRYGSVVVGRAGRVTGFEAHARPGPGLINAGIYRLHRDAFGGRAVGSTFSLEAELLPQLAIAGAVTAVTLHGEFIDIGVPEDYLRFCALHG
jgi:D-glycero-alpha-D-manno-heptose 1-phosphate guanylyltransferase